MEMSLVPNASPVPVEYVVLRFTDGWKILCGARRWGRFAFQVDAVEAALRLARAAVAKGVETRVVVQDLWGQLSPCGVV
jgi:hypothetical protein